MSGEIFANRYLVGAELGVGGMGMVYEAQDLRTHGRVALKVLHPWLAREQDFVARLHREAEVAASIDSPRVVRILDVDFHEGRPFLVMEYLPGPTLAERIAEAGRLPWREVVAVGVEIGRALEAAHAKRVYHRDLSPRNIKIADGQVKVLDFGIARAEAPPPSPPPAWSWARWTTARPSGWAAPRSTHRPKARRGDALRHLLAQRHPVRGARRTALPGQARLGDHPRPTCRWSRTHSRPTCRPRWPRWCCCPAQAAGRALHTPPPSSRRSSPHAVDDPHRTVAPPPVTSPAAPGPPPATDQVTRTVAVGPAERAARSGSAVPTDRAFAAESANSARKRRRGRNLALGALAGCVALAAVAGGVLVAGGGQSRRQRVAVDPRRWPPRYGGTRRHAHGDARPYGDTHPAPPRPVVIADAGLHPSQ
ncbi:MAG: serine/threonine-protein kinase [Dehalococcoidia bacterium]